MGSTHPFATSFAHNVYKHKYSYDGVEEWSDTARRVVEYPMDALHQAPKARQFGRTNIEAASDRLHDLVNNRLFIPGGRYLYASGRQLHQVQNCLLLDVEDSREGWADLAYKAGMALMTGAGIGSYYGRLREAGATIKKTGGIATGPVPLAISINEQGRAYVQGGNRRCAIWGGLLWSHPDVFSWIRAKDWPDWLREQKDKDFSVPAPLDSTNISVCLDDDFFDSFHNPNFSGPITMPSGAHSILAPDGRSWHEWAQEVYWKTIDKMTTTGEPGFSVDIGDKREEKLRNACTEITSADDSDICNLGGIVLSRFDDPKEFGEAVRMGVIYLTAGTLYSDVPYPKVAEVREKNRRLGLDLVGVHEFLLKRGVRYGSDESFEVLDPFMAEYDRALEYAWDAQDKLGISRSVAATSGAPTGTRAIIVESTTGWEPVTATAYKRRVRNSSHLGDKVTYEYVVDPTVKRLIDEGFISENDTVEDAYSLAYDYERRFKMQKYAQSHVDQAISMTINIPEPMFDHVDQRVFGESLIDYLPHLRGITVYPNNSRAGQPITPVTLEEAVGNEGVVFEESEEKCAVGLCGV